MSLRRASVSTNSTGTSPSRDFLFKNEVTDAAIQTNTNPLHTIASISKSEMVSGSSTLHRRLRSISMVSDRPVELSRVSSTKSRHSDKNSLIDSASMTEIDQNSNRYGANVFMSDEYVLDPIQKLSEDQLR